jgi:hypothetical protein
MHGAQNAVVGDQDLPTVLPETQVPEEVLTEEKKMAKYSQSTEFKRLREFIEDRIKYFQRYYPNGQQVQDLPADERAAYWQAACVIVKEFEGILTAYDQARETVKDHARSEVS